MKLFINKLPEIFFVKKCYTISLAPFTYFDTKIAANL